MPATPGMVYQCPRTGRKPAGLPPRERTRRPPAAASTTPDCSDMGNVLPLPATPHRLTDRPAAAPAIDGREESRGGSPASSCPITIRTRPGTTTADNRPARIASRAPSLSDSLPGNRVNCLNRWREYGMQEGTKKQRPEGVDAPPARLTATTHPVGRPVSVPKRVSTIGRASCFQ